LVFLLQKGTKGNGFLADIEFMKRMKSFNNGFLMKVLFLGLALTYLLAGASSVLPAPLGTGSVLFLERPAKLALDPGSDPTVIRQRPVAVDFNLLSERTVPRGKRSPEAGKLVLNLFDDAVFNALLQRVESSRLGGFVWIGRLEGVGEEGQVILSVHEGVLTGKVSLPGRSFQIRPDATGLPAVFEIDPTAFPSEAEPLSVEPLGQRDAHLGVTTDDGSLIDVLVVYSGDARAAAGGTSAMNALINLAVSETNAGYQNSGITQRIRLVHAEEVVYSEAGFNWSTTLSRLTSPVDGFMDNVHSLRDAYQADLVVLIVNNTAYCGIAWLMTTPSPAFESNAFSVVSRTCATGYYSLAHEMGHNMGSHHDRANASGSGSYLYSYGYQAPDRAFRTIMAYNCSGGGCPRVNYWSNPEVLYGGQPTGVLDPEPNSADNHRSLNNTAYTVANWRVSTSAPPTVSTGPASDVQTNSAQLNGVVNPQGLATSGLFQWGTSTAYGSSTPILSLGSGSTDLAVSAEVSGLQANTIYHYRLVASSSAGTTYGADGTFSSPLGAPLASTGEASQITTQTAVLNGMVNPQGVSSGYFFQWGTSPAYGNSTPILSLGSGSTDLAVSAEVSGLLANTIYHFRLVAASSAGTTYGADGTFSPPLGAPLASTGEASQITTQTVVLNGAVNPQGLSSSYFFQWGFSPGVWNQTAPQPAGSGSNFLPALEGLKNLNPGKRYYYRIAASNETATVYGSTLSFVTDPFSGDHKLFLPLITTGNGESP
jgi:hypothetical protein